MNAVRPLTTAQGFDNPQQRKHDRYVVEIPGLLRIAETRGGIYAVTLLDVSESGFRVSCPKPIPSGTRVEVKCRAAKILGTVRYAREVEYEFHLGVEAAVVDVPGGGAENEKVDLISLFPPPATRLRRT